MVQLRSKFLLIFMLTEILKMSINVKKIFANLLEQFELVCQMRVCLLFVMLLRLF